jgi:hypothetical protein
MFIAVFRGQVILPDLSKCAIAVDIKISNGCDPQYFFVELMEKKLCKTVTQQIKQPCAIRLLHPIPPNKGIFQ